MTRKKSDTDNARYYIESGIDFEKRRIRIDDEIEDFSIGMAVCGIQKMIDQNNEKPIDVYISSYGGSVYDGLEFCDLLENLEVEVRTHASGKIMSMALIIFCCGDLRYATKRARFMAHSLSSGTEGKVFEQKIDVKEAEVLNEQLLEILAERSVKTKAWWKKEIEYKDKYFGKEVAVNLGVVNAE